MKEKFEEIMEVMKWIGEGIEHLEARDQLQVILAITEMVEKIKPTYKKYTKKKQEPESLEDFLKYLINKPKEE